MSTSSEDPQWSIEGLSPAEVDDCLTMPTLADAAAQALWWLAERRVYTWISDRGSRPLVLIVPTGADGYSWSRIVPSAWFVLADEELTTTFPRRPAWRRGSVRASRVVPSDKAWANRNHLDQALTGFVTMPHTLTRAITDDGSWQIRAALVGAWWDDRLTEGHTPESARTLLSLLLPPDAMDRCAFLDEPRSGPPHAVRCGRYRLAGSR